MTRTSAEPDPFFQLLTEALRAGPGTAQWGEAVARLRDGGIEGADEYRLIIRAREDLEKGRDFRKVSAGPGFTRKVLEAVEREGRRRQGLPTATIVAVLAGLVILGVIVTVIVLMSRGGATAGGAQEAAVQRLQAASLPVSVASGGVPGALQGFREMRAMPSTASTRTAGLSLTGVVTAEPLDADAVASVDAEFVLPAGNPRVQLFVADAPDAPTREIAWSFGDGRARVDVPGLTPEPVPFVAVAGRLNVSIRFDREHAVVAVDGRRLYAGPHNLGDAPRYAGARVIASGADGDAVTVKSISVAKAAAAVAPAGGS